ncbi:hypothetical protein [Nocardia wallacei]|uniref:hypothetical protein n=1 Tax=Nocardia wallacei TaxID=480035 RepID=UPI0024555D9F|nr:hypothetical protein [Nocardia wallacei]
MTVDDRDRSRETVVVGILADPDLPARLARDLGHALPGVLANRVDDRVTWRTEVVDDPFEAMYPDYDRLVDKAHERVRTTEWDLALCVTDLPLRGPRGFVMATVDIDSRVALVSLPALGGLRLRRRLTDLAAALTARMEPGYRPETGLLQDFTRQLGSRAVRVERARTDDEVHVLRSPQLGTAHLLAGMVRANRPWQLLVGLSTALAGAIAGTAFGVLYSSIWQLATALGPARLAGSTVAALSVLTVWIIAGHGLWERDENVGATSDPDRRLRNAGTVATVLVGSAAFFATLYLLTLAAVLLVIPPDFLGKTLGHAAGVRDYLTIALTATILGTVAGAVGSGLEDDTTVRKAAYNHRRRERYRWVEQRGES